MSLERRALRAGQPVPWCKTIKFQTDPSVKMLSMELRAVPEAENRSSFDSNATRLNNLERFLALDHVEGLDSKHMKEVFEAFLSSR